MSPADRGSAEELLRKGTKDKVFPFFPAGVDGAATGASECESTAKSKCVVDCNDGNYGGDGHGGNHCDRGDLLQVIACAGIC